MPGNVPHEERTAAKPNESSRRFGHPDLRNRAEVQRWLSQIRKRQRARDRLFAAFDAVAAVHSRNAVVFYLNCLLDEMGEQEGKASLADDLDDPLQSRDFAVLNYLKDRQAPSFELDIATAVRVDRKTIRPRLYELLRRGYIMRPKSTKRKGYLITEEGRKAATAGQNSP